MGLFSRLRLRNCTCSLKKKISKKSEKPVDEPQKVWYTIITKNKGADSHE
jgi:hypothetical protein